MIVHRLTNDGIRHFHGFLDSQTTTSAQQWTKDLLCDTRIARPIDTIVDLELRDFSTRMDLVAYIHTRFEGAGVKAAANDGELWAWIAWLYYERICPRAADGSWAPGARQRWIPESGDWRRYYRHLVAGPWAIYRAHRDDPRRAMAVLCQPPGRPGDVVEQLASRQLIVTSPSIMQFATNTFVNPNTGSLKRGAGGKGAGSARRLIAVLGQFDRTWDFDVIGADKLGRLMPGEFRR